MRKNRRDTKNPVHDDIHREPAAFTRASRRAAGHRGGVHTQAMREFYAANTVFPRAVRRLLRDPMLAQKRITNQRAKVNRLLAPYGRSI